MEIIEKSRKVGFLENGNKYDYTQFSVIVDDKEIAFAMFAEEEDHIWCQNVWVVEEYRRQRLATKLYGMAMKHFAKPILQTDKTDTMTELGELFWLSYGA